MDSRGTGRGSRLRGRGSRPGSGRVRGSTRFRSRRMRIVVLDGYCLNPGDLSWDALRALGDLEVFDRTPAAEAETRARGAALVLTNKTPLPAAVLERLPDLKYIGVLATGYNIVDVKAASRLGIIVTNIPTYGT